MRIFYYLMIVALLIMIPSAAHADMVGVAYIIIFPLGFLLSIPVASIIEMICLVKLSDLYPIRAFQAALSANLTSALVGLIIYLLSFQYFIILMRNFISLIILLTILFVLTVVIEWPIYHKYRVRNNKLETLKITAILNLISYILISIPLTLLFR